MAIFDQTSAYGRQYKPLFNPLPSFRKKTQPVAQQKATPVSSPIVETVNPVSLAVEALNTPTDSSSPETTSSFEGTPSRGFVKDTADKMAQSITGFGTPASLAKEAGSLGFSFLSSAFTGTPIPAAQKMGDIAGKAAITSMASDRLAKEGFVDFSDEDSKGFGTTSGFAPLNSKVVRETRKAMEHPVFGAAKMAVQGFTDVDPNASFDPSTNARDFDVTETLGRGSMAMQGISLNSKGQPVQKQGEVQEQTIDPETNTYVNVEGGGVTQGGVDMGSSENKGMGINSGFGIASPGSSSNTSDPTSSDFSGDVGEGVGGGDGSVLCTELHRQGILSDTLYEADSKYGGKLDSDIISGYHRWAVPVARAMKKSRIVTMFWKPLVLAWAEHAAYKEGVLPKDNSLGIFIEFIGIPICRFLNKKEVVQWQI